MAMSLRTADYINRHEKHTDNNIETTKRKRRMGIPWGIEHSGKQYCEKDSYLGAWEKFCQSGCCNEFVVPYDETFYHFKSDGGNVSITAAVNKAAFTIMNQLKCSDGTYDELSSLIGESDLYLPDNIGQRAIPGGNLLWDYMSADSITKLLYLPANGENLERELRAAAEFCYNYGTLISFSWA